MFISKESSLYLNYLTVLKNRVFKILPLAEENNEGLPKYLDSLLFELYGLQYVIDGVKDSHNYISLMSTLEAVQLEIIEPDIALEFLRSEILKSLNIIDKLLKRGV
ncbi:hypothetical protein FZC83_02365 [Rossellomorea marisflavi]|uniref:Uncharacterized protein n=1 Tax=Rossellomorea marisflavi TaxID=189381 RepID=A0A5D4S2Q7_9BACI|nr:hypothetical protein [Rossellomorea marisflavi]TYS56438.1 hypothetical protein FZC83_02365 [Rossellomorea marisflavi]